MAFDDTRDTSPVDLTSLLHLWAGGDATALDRLVAEVYGELHKTATRCLNGGGRGGTLQATVLVHELYLRLVTQTGGTFENRRAFFGFAAKVMRNILVDAARARGSLKRGADAVRIPLSDDLAFVDVGSEDILDLTTALDALTAIDPRKGELVELCAFLGCSRDEAADLLGISRRTAMRDFRLARAWLSHRLRSVPERGRPE